MRLQGVDCLTRNADCHSGYWRGDAEKTLDIKKDPDKSYRNLQKAMAKLFKNYPPGSTKK